MDPLHLDRWAPLDSRKFLGERYEEAVVAGDSFKDRPTVVVLEFGDFTVSKLLEMRRGIENELKGRGCLHRDGTKASDLLRPLETMDDFKALAISCALESTGGNKTAAAKRLGINIKTLYNLVKRLKATSTPPSESPPR